MLKLHVCTCFSGTKVTVYMEYCRVTLQYRGRQEQNISTFCGKFEFFAHILRLSGTGIAIGNFHIWDGLEIFLGNIVQVLIFFYTRKVKVLSLPESTFRAKAFRREIVLFISIQSWKEADQADCGLESFEIDHFNLESYTLVSSALVIWHLSFDKSLYF